MFSPKKQKLKLEVVSGTLIELCIADCSPSEKLPYHLFI